MKKFPFLFLAIAPLVARAAVPLPDDIKHVCVVVGSRVNGTFSGTMAAGTGFFIAPDLVLTCNHVTRVPTWTGQRAAEEIWIEMSGRRAVHARVVARDTEHDLALLKVGARTNGDPLEVGRSSPSRGDEIAIAGNFPDSIKIARGEIVSRTLMDGYAMADAKVRSGYSGGPVFGSDGKVIGLLSLRDDDNNAIFVRSDVILSFMKRYEARIGKPIFSMTDGSQASASSAQVRGAMDDRQNSNSATAVAPRVAIPAAQHSSNDTIVVALPVRKGLACTTRTPTGRTTSSHAPQ